MSSVGKFIGKAVGGLTGATQAAEGAKEASYLQAASADKAIAEQQRQFDTLVALMAPYVTAGEDALTGQRGILGLEGPGEQAKALASLERSPEFQALTEQGEEAILQNASATGGLRGGNVQGALAQFRPQVLSRLIDSRFNRLGQISHLGQASAAGQGAAGLQIAANTGNLLQQQGAALAGGVLAKSGVTRQAFTDAINIGKTAASAMSGGAF